MARDELRHVRNLRAGQHAKRSPHAAAVSRVLTLAHDPRDATGSERLRALASPPDRHLPNG